ncbi:MAG: uroporphyrinogen-III synthase, partial [Bryobacteraceae bacterium]
MKKLDGLRIVVTRAAHQAEELAGPLRERGAQVLLLPAIAIAPPVDPHALEQAAAHADEFDWIIFTSANAIAAFVAALGHAPGDFRARVATVGSATRAAAESAGFTVSLMPEKYVAEALVESFGSQDLAGQRVLIPSAAVT